MSGIMLFICWILWMSLWFFASISFSQTESRVPCQREFKKVLPMKARQWQQLEANEFGVKKPQWVRGSDSPDSNDRNSPNQELVSESVFHSSGRKSDRETSTKTKQFFLKRQQNKMTLNVFSSRQKSRKLIYTDNSRWNLGKHVNNLSWNHRTSKPRRSETNGIAERAVRVKEGTSAVLRKFRTGWKVVVRFHGMPLPSAKCPRPPSRRENSVWTNLVNHWKGPIIPFGAMVEYHPTSTRDLSRIHQLCKKVIQAIFLGYELIAVGIWKGENLIADIEELENIHASGVDPWRINAKEVLIPRKVEEFIFPIADGTAKLSGRDYGFRVVDPEVGGGGFFVWGAQQLRFYNSRNLEISIEWSVVWNSRILEHKNSRTHYRILEF